MKFQCQDSCGGKCCKPWMNGRSSFVFLTLKDRQRIAGYLKQPVHNFAKKSVFSWTRFTTKVSEQWHLAKPWFLARNDDGTCQFLVDGKCKIYPVRPTQCRTFPFWPENLKEEIWAELKEHCPGIDKGEELDLAKVQIQLMDQESADVELRN